MKFKLIICISVLSIFLSFCHKTEKNAPIRGALDIKVSDEIKAWAYYKPGSYWVMRDSMYGYLDSVYVYSINSQVKEYYTADKNVKAEEITISYNYNSVLLYDVILCSFPTDHIEIYNYQTIKSVVFDPDTTHKTSSSSGGITYNSFFPAMSVAGNNYTNVHCTSFSFLNTVTHNGAQTNIGTDYWVKNIGRIKRRGYNSSFYYTSYDLLRYHVVQ